MSEHHNPISYIFKLICVYESGVVSVYFGLQIVNLKGNIPTCFSVYWYFALYSYTSALSGHWTAYMLINSFYKTSLISQ